MATPAQELLNVAFYGLIQQENNSRGPKIEIAADAHIWQEGEAEEWLQDIVAGKYRLDYHLNTDTGMATPCLRS
jgi:hypothetical protein